MLKGFPGGSDGKASVYIAGDPGSSPGLGRSPGEGKKWQSTPVLLPGKSHGQRSLVGYSLWGHKESDTTERLHFHFHFQSKDYYPGGKGHQWREHRGMGEGRNSTHSNENAGTFDVMSNKSLNFSEPQFSYL